MQENSIDVIERWLGDDFSLAAMDKIAQAPPEQVGHLVEQLAESYYGWDDRWRTSQEGRPDFLYVGDHYASDDARKAAWLSRVKTASLVFENAAFEDPLATELFSPIVTGMVGLPQDVEQLREMLRRGMAALLDLQSLASSRAISLVPQVQLTELQDVQQVARKEMEGFQGSPEERMLQGWVAAHSALCAIFELVPVAGNEAVQSILADCFERFRLGMNNEQIEFANSFNRLSIPNLSRLPAQEIVALRADSEAFAALRRQFREAVRAARTADADLVGEDRFGSLWVEELKEQQRKVEKELSGSDTIRPLIASGVWAIDFGALNLYLDPTILENRARLITALGGMAAPGVTWMATQLLRRFSQKQRSGRLVAEIYTSLLELGPPRPS